jgi:type I restriction enzyme, S subunit
MEVRPGYKPTGVGAIPEDWEVVQLGNLKPFVTSGSRGWASFYSEQGSLFVRITNLSRQSIYLDLTDSKFVNVPPESSEGMRTQLEEHDVLISITADIGIIGYIDRSVPTPAYINQHIALVRFDPAKVSGKFVSYFLASENPQKLFRSSTDTGAKAGMSLGTVLKIQTAFPPRPEQCAIAAALSDADALLEGLTRLIIKKRDLKQAAMQQLLTGKTRLPGFAGNWEIRPVAEMGDVLAGKALNVQGLGALRPYLRTKNVLDGRIDLEDVLLMPMTDAEFNRFRIKRGDVLLNEGQSIELVGRCAMYRGELGSPCAMQNQLLRFRAYGKTVPAFAEHLFRRCQHVGVFATIATQTTSVAHLGSSRFSDLRLSWPIDPKEQEAIATALSDMDAELRALEARHEKTRALKQAMMQELLTGRTRLV